MKKIRVALADDEALVRAGFVAILKADDEFEVVAEAANGKQLVQRLANLTTPPDVCLLDISMPEMNGYNTLVALRPRYPNMPFLILTQLEHDFIIVRMLKAGASGYLLKTVEPTELKDAIKKIQKHHFYYNEHVDGRLIHIVQSGDEVKKKLVLTKPEEVFLKWCCSDLGYKEIAKKMGIKESLAIYYRKQLFEKLHTQSRTGLALHALRMGLVSRDAMRPDGDNKESEND